MSAQLLSTWKTAVIQRQMLVLNNPLTIRFLFLSFVFVFGSFFL